MDSASRRLALPARPALLDRLRAASAPVGVLLVDIDRFRDVRTAYGLPAADALLDALAARLTAAVRPGDAVLPAGGDAIAVVCDGLGGAWDALELARRAAAAWEAPFVLAGEEVFVSASTGVAHGAGDADELLRRADAALHRARERGPGGVELYDDALRAGARARVRVASDLRRALADGDLDVCYQPIVDLDTGCVRGVEALARWTHATRGAVSPGVFIPVAEATGLIGALGRHVLMTACRQLAAWRAELPGAEDMWMAVNVSPHQIAGGELPGDVKAALRASDLPPDALALEVIESAMLDDSDAPGPVLALLRSLGVRIVLDDFGTGYSSLSYLRRLPIDGLKLDRSFIDGVGHPDAAAVVEAIVGMSTKLGLLVTAEGVETREHLERLRALGCTLGQGYMLARPLPADAVAELLRRAGAPQARIALNES